MSEELKPCKYCNVWNTKKIEHYTGGKLQSAYLECQGCKLQLSKENSLELATEIWNRRA